MPDFTVSPIIHNDDDARSPVAPRLGCRVPGSRLAPGSLPYAAQAGEPGGFTLVPQQ
jgi:hypothetical protein